MKLADLQKRTMPATVDLYGEPLNLQVRPNTWTIGLLTDERSLAEAISLVVADWDLTDNGEPVPITPDAIREQIGLPVQQAIWAGIAETFDPNSMKRSKTSSTT